MRRALFGLIFAVVAVPAQAQTPITYHVTFPGNAAAHHWMQVEVRFTGVGSAPLQARMSRSSPGRYAVHEFAKNVFWVEAYDGTGRALTCTRPNVDEWDVAGHDGTVRLVYRIFGDHADGTYFGVDTTHAHLNMPAAFMWRVGHESDPMRITFTPPADSRWQVGTQLYPTSDPFTFTAPNLQYFMDSPTELSDFMTSEFSLPNAGGTTARFRLVVHGGATQADVNALTSMVERLVREEEAVYGEFPSYEPGTYTFLLDYVPWGYGDGMEHRNSTSISNPGLSLASEQGRRRALDTIAHEFFHNWNVERIRPVGLEPFDFTRENITCCLWLAEGFTQYYGPLLLNRAGFSQSPPLSSVNAVVNGSGRTVRSAVQMSEYGPFNDAATSIDLRDANRTFISYYTYGAAVALALDLSLRERSNGRQSLDDFMRLLWQRFGKPGGAAPGLVGHPYSLADLRQALADLTGDRAFANGFFDKYIEGRDAADYKTLLAAAGYDVRPARPGAGWIGDTPVDQVNGGLLVGVTTARGGEQALPVPFNTPLYGAGVDEGDVIVSIDGAPATRAAWSALNSRKPGDMVTLVVERRDGQRVTTTATLVANPALSIVPVENEPGGALTDAQRAFRQSWLGTHVR
jgi:predicted metalloprotease with PDZ domain